MYARRCLFGRSGFKVDPEISEQVGHERAGWQRVPQSRSGSLKHAIKNVGSLTKVVLNVDKGSPQEIA